jgi:hypothetical protein
MPLDQLTLFAVVSEPGPVRREDYAQRPIGKRRSRRYSPAATARGPTLASRVAAIRTLLEAHGALLVEIGAAIEKLTAEVLASHSERRRIGEQLDRLLRSQVETRRQLGQTQLHIPPRHSRRRPLGLD